MAAALEQPADWQGAEFVAEPFGCGDDHAAQLHERLAADIDRAAARDQQQPERLAPLPCARERECFATADRT